MKTKSLRGEKGQAAVLITLLQAQAIAKAQEYVINNGGAEELYAPPEGTGGGLVKGIAVMDADVRVALQTLVDTYFTMIFNRSEALVGARSHCNARSAGGLLPIAVRRYDVHEPAGTLDLLANKHADPRDPYGGVGYPADSTPTPWEGRYGPMTVYLPNDYVPEDILDKDDPLTGAIDCDVPPGDDPPDYVGICVLGDGVGTNDGTANYEGFVLLDARNIVPGPVWYYNGATGQADTNKAISKGYFHEGYKGPMPQVGDQLAMLDGVSNDFAAQEMAQYYEVGEEFLAVIYSGYVWDVPDLEMSIEPAVQHISPTIGMTGTIATVTYTVTLEKAGPSPWEANANFALQASFMELGGTYGEITPTVDIPSPVILPQWQPSVQVPMTVSVFITDTNFLSEYVSALTVGTEAIGLGLKRWASTNFRYGDVDGDFTMYAGALEFNVPQGGSLDIPLITRGFGCADGKTSLSANSVGYAWESVFTSGQSGKIKVLDGKDGNSTFTLKVKDDAILGWHTVRLIADPACAPAHSVDIAVYVYEPTPGGEPKRFVIVEGFAQFRVSYKDANTIGAYAIGPIFNCLDCDEAPISGLNPRLLPW